MFWLCGTSNTKDVNTGPRENFLHESTLPKETLTSVEKNLFPSKVWEGRGNLPNNHLSISRFETYTDFIFSFFSPYLSSSLKVTA